MEKDHRGMRQGKASNTPKGRTTDVGTFIHDGTLPLRYSMLLDLAPTYTFGIHCEQNVIVNHITEYLYSSLVVQLVPQNLPITLFLSNLQIPGNNSIWLIEFLEPGNNICFMSIIHDITVKE